MQIDTGVAEPRGDEIYRREFCILRFPTPIGVLHLRPILLRFPRRTRARNSFSRGDRVLGLSRPVSPLIYRLGFSGRGIRKRGITPPQIIPRGQRVVVVAALNGSTTGGFSALTLSYRLPAIKHISVAASCIQIQHNERLLLSPGFQVADCECASFYRYFSLVSACWRFISR